MDKLEEWFNEVPVKFSGNDDTFVIYKGFKITKTENNYKLVDVRLNDFYTEVRKKDLDILNKLGFIKGADFISHKRDSRRVDIYDKKITQLKENLISHKALLNTNKTFYRKKIKNDSENVDKFTNLLYFYKARIIQYNSKYNLNKQDE